MFSNAADIYKNKHQNLYLKIPLCHSFIFLYKIATAKQVFFMVY